VANQTGIAADSLLVDRTLWRQLQTQLSDAVKLHHQDFPEQNGMPQSQVRPILTTLCRRNVPTTLLVRLEKAILGDLSRSGIVCANGLLRNTSHHPALPPRLREAAETLRNRLAEHPFDPPSCKNLAPDEQSQQALHFLLSTGEAVDLSNGIVVSSDAYARAMNQIRAHISCKGGATVSELKTLLGSSPRIVVPLLERLDRDGITRRDGNIRQLATRQGGQRG